MTTPTVEAMTRYGGSFVQALAEAYRRADAQNQARLEGAFPEIWNRYEGMATFDQTLGATIGTHEEESE